jgi:hypothetical protein
MGGFRLTLLATRPRSAQKHEHLTSSLRPERQKQCRRASLGPGIPPPITASLTSRALDVP